MSEASTSVVLKLISVTGSVLCHQCLIIKPDA